MQKKANSDNLHLWALTALVLLLTLSVAAQFSGLYIQVKIFDSKDWYKNQSICEANNERLQKEAGVSVRKPQ